VWANSARMLLSWAVPQGKVWICQKGNQSVRILMKTIIDGSIRWMGNALKWVTIGVNNLWIFMYSNYTVIWSLLCITSRLVASIGKRDSNKFQRRILGNLCYEWVQTSLNQILAACNAKKSQRHGPNNILKMSVNGESKILVLAYLLIKAQCGSLHS
jgi:hypothetical protein